MTKTSKPEAEERVKRALPKALRVLGIVIMVIFGLGGGICTIAFPEAIALVLILSGIPFATGVGLYFLGTKLVE